MDHVVQDVKMCQFIIKTRNVWSFLCFCSSHLSGDCFPNYKSPAWHRVLIECDNKPSVRTKNIPKEKVFNGRRGDILEMRSGSLGKILFIYNCFPPCLIQFCATQLFIFEVFNFVFYSCPAFSSSAGLTGHYSYSSDLLALSDCFIHWT